ncbi:DUF5777 family beta-barrel protein [Adhaeribacter soli]|uniref:DUF5777 domain-containing protein n=1 Tax=Adhaeribacter soli TaxID=2607655 RepID=A0A5N1IWN4_9BACT|nr:DUF5777 family beta-barrel protein [Adhaeribacter soli]KAA9338925.1 hypothetical protein F0P94_09035 [Adhaeribacter soli]
MNTPFFKFLFLGLTFFCFSSTVFAQDDLLSLIEDDKPQREFAKASFKTTRVINSQSLENTAGGVLDMKISHRFGPLNGGAYELFGLDAATIRIGLDYGVSDRLMIGVGRSSVQKTFDGFLKMKLLRQSSGAKTMPLTVIWFSGTALNSLKWQYPERENYFSSRLAFTHQLIFGRKFSEGFTLQFMPTVVHRNLVATPDEKHDVMAAGVAGRLKLTKRLAVNAEYYYVLPDQISEQFKNSLAIGFDIETGGHVFQLHFTNSTAMVEKGFITETTGSWEKGDIRFGFNISRVFTIKQSKAD